MMGKYDTRHRFTGRTAAVGDTGHIMFALDLPGPRLPLQVEKSIESRGLAEEKISLTPAGQTLPPT